MARGKMSWELRGAAGSKLKKEREYPWKGDRDEASEVCSMCVYVWKWRGRGRGSLDMIVRLIVLVPLVVVLLLRGVAPQCGLNLSAYPYVAYEECGWVQEPMDEWDSFPNTVCCRNALTLLSQALASQARHDSPQQATLFISSSEWDACSHAFRLRYGLSPDSCGFHDLSLGSSKCSDLTLPDIQGQQFYQAALDQCAHFDHPSSDSCSSCVSAVLNIRDSLYDQLLGRHDIPLERAVCGVAALVSLAAGKPDDPSLSDKFLRCWPPPLNNGIPPSPPL